MLTHYLIIFFVSMVPLIELRGAIPYAVGFIQAGSPLSLPLCYLIAIVGNMLPVPFLIKFLVFLSAEKSCNYDENNNSWN